MCLLHPKSYISPAVLSSPFFWVDCRRLFKEGRHRLPGVAAAVVTPAPVPKAGDLFHPPRIHGRNEVSHEYHPHEVGSCWFPAPGCPSK